MAELLGWAFPIEADPLTGRIKTVADDELVRQSIELILGTSPGERYLYPEFGCGLRDFVFETINYTTLKRIESEVRRSVEKWERRMTLDEVRVSTDGKARIFIDITYRIKSGETIFYYRYNLDVR